MADIEDKEQIVYRIKLQVSRWFIATLDPILFILHLTAIYVIFVLADTAVLALISWSFGDAVKQSRFAESMLEGIHRLSALGIASAYGIHMIYCLFRQANDVTKMLQRGSDSERHDDD